MTTSEEGGRIKHVSDIVTYLILEEDFKMKKNYLKIALPFALATVFSFPALLPDNPIGLTPAVVSASMVQADIPAGNLHKLEIGTVTVYDFGKVKLHAYNTGDPLADEFYALESKDGLVLLESGAFKANVSEFDAYLKSLKKPLKGQLLSYHPNGYSTYDSKAPIYATEGALASWGEKGGVRALTNNFVQGFGAEKVAADLPSTAVIVKPGETVKIAGIDFKILATSDVEGNYSVEIPAIKAVYRHMMGSNVHNILPSVDYIDAEIADMKKYQQEGYKMILTSHYVPEGQTAVAEKIKYLRKIKELVFASADKESFIKNVKEAFPDYEGVNYLEMSAGMLFPAK
mgnify:CR=1 FL=1